MILLRDVVRFQHVFFSRRFVCIFLRELASVCPIFRFLSFLRPSVATHPFVSTFHVQIQVQSHRGRLHDGFCARHGREARAQHGRTCGHAVVLWSGLARCSAIPEGFPGTQGPSKDRSKTVHFSMEDRPRTATFWEGSTSSTIDWVPSGRDGCPSLSPFEKEGLSVSIRMDARFQPNRDRRERYRSWL